MENNLLLRFFFLFSFLLQINFQNKVDTDNLHINLHLQNNSYLINFRETNAMDTLYGRNTKIIIYEFFFLLAKENYVNKYLS